MKIHDIEYFKNIFKNQESQFLEEYFTFLRFPTISADPSMRPHVKQCAQWLEMVLHDAGFQVDLWDKERAPVVFAQHLEAGFDQPTLLIYNHYDVQPVDPLEQWKHDPFSPVKEGNVISARGAQDNKGQCFYVLAALLSYLKHEKKFPINIKLLIEGEEESGSGALSKLLKEKKELLQSDHLIVVDLGMRQQYTPAITLGTRGLVTVNVEIESTNGDLHSGSHGGLAYNPLHALVQLMSQARDVHGHITIPGFYDDVVYPDAAVLAQMNLSFSESDYFKQFGAYPTGGEKSFTPLERNWLRPTLELNGIGGGYQGPGGKTVIPASGFAKISCRLVPNQDPEKIGRLLKSYFESSAPKGTRVSVTVGHGMGAAVRTPASSQIIQALGTALSEVFLKKCEYIFEGATIPIVPELQEASGAEVAMFGFGLAEDRIHAPNESFGWDRIEKGFLTMSRLIELLAR